jgi:hypothetical protein
MYPFISLWNPADNLRQIFVKITLHVNTLRISGYSLTAKSTVTFSPHVILFWTSEFQNKQICLSMQ